MNIQGKNILLMMPEFYHLKDEIYNELKINGANVIYVESRVYKEDFRLNKVFSSFIFFILNPLFKKKYTKNVINVVKGKHIDIFLCIGIYASNRKLIKYLKKHNKNIKTVIYFWDAFITWDFSKYIDYFDISYTFDRNDYMKYNRKGLKYLPLFYVKNNKSNKPEYDITHIGTLGKKYKKRIVVLDKIINYAKTNNINIFVRSYSAELNSIFFKKRNLKNKMQSYFYFIFDKEYRMYIKELKKYKNKGFIYEDKLNYEICSKIESSSKCILDVNIENSGSAYRIIKAISMQIKVITTNKYIKQEPFYSEENICVIDKENPTFDIEFISTPFKKINIDFLRIDNWIFTILNS